MMTSEWFVIGSIVLLLVTGVIHFFGGEIYLIRPLFKHRGNRIFIANSRELDTHEHWNCFYIYWAF
jgi:hypothetical protein